MTCLTSWRFFLAASFLLLGLYILLLRGAWFTGDVVYDGAGEPPGADYVNIWTAARLALDGRLGEVFQPFGFHAAQEQLLGQSFQHHSWSYPPHFIPLILAFGAVPYLWGFAL